MIWIFASIIFGLFIGLLLGEHYSLEGILRKINFLQTNDDNNTTSNNNNKKAESDIYKLAEDAEDFYDKAAHPKHLLENEQFKKAVDLLCSPKNSIAELRSLYAGDNELISCITLEALSRRKDSENIRKEILLNLNTLDFDEKPLFFALRFLSSKKTDSLIGKVILKSSYSWAYNGQILQILRDFIDEQKTKGTDLSFLGEDIKNTDQDDLEVVETVLKAIGKNKTKILLDNLEKSKKTFIDESFLKSFGKIWAKNREIKTIVDHEELNKLSDEIQDTFTTKPPRSLILIGEPSVGKTTLIKLASTSLQKKGWIIFEAGSTDLMAGQSYIGQIEGRIKNLIQNISDGNKVLWVIPDINEIIFAGRHSSSPISIMDMILPFVESGRINIIGETSPSAYEQICKINPRIKSAFSTLIVNPLDDKNTLKVAKNWAALQVGSSKNEGLSEKLIEEAFQLSKQYLVDKSNPGNLVDFLKYIISKFKSSKKEKITTDTILENVSDITGLPKDIVDDKEGINLEQLKNLFNEKVKGQPEAVECLVEKIAMIKSGLNDPTRPLGVFLFVGPTGTGKTEIAKTAAEFLFGSEQRLIRLDMSEFKTWDSEKRILGDSLQISDTNALVNLVRKQPFSIVLLDEFEKAHPHIWDLFLQVFDDGRLTDRFGNTVDFRHCIIIMTSNLGATIPYGMNIGFGSEGTIFSITNVEKSIRETFRSELVNRIDRTVVFRPLGRKIVEEILYKELKSILSRRGFRSREWAVEWEESAIEFLIQKGFSKEFGARPLKRAIERYLLSPLSITILNHQYPEGDQFLFISSDGNKILVEFVDPNEKEIETSLEKDITKIEKEKSELTLKSIVLFQKGILDELSLIEQKTNDLKGKIQSEIWENNKHLLIKETSNINFWDSPQRFEILSKIEYMDRVESSFKIANSLLERIKGTDYNSNKKSFSKPLIKRIAQQLYLIETANRDLEENKPNESFLLVESFDSYPPNNSIIEYTASLFSMYKNWAKKRRMRFEVLFDSTKINNVSRYVASISGFGAYTILEPETGIHVFESTEADKNVTKNKIRVKVAAQLIEHIDKKESLLSIADKLFSNNTNPTNKIVRTYRYKSSPLVKDNNRKWKTGRIDKVLGGDFDLMS